MDTSKRLDAWLTAANMSQSAFARACGFDRHNMYRVVKGQSKPSLNMAAAIERETGGVIPAVDWAVLP